MSAAVLHQALALLAPHFAAVALCAARLLPIAFLCPMLGGQAAPMTVRLGVSLALALSVHLVGGIAPAADLNGWQLAGAGVREALLGVALGLLAALPFDAARMGGRLIDLFRGASAEASLPLAGSRETATGDFLYQLTLALAIVGGALPLVLGALWKSFALLPLGSASLGAAGVEQVIARVALSFATGLAIGAPVAGAAMAADAVVGLIARAAPQIGVADLSSPIKLIAGGAVLWLALGLVGDRILASALDSSGAIHAVLASAR